MMTPIKKLYPNQINGPHGPKTKFDVYVDVNGAEFKFESFKGIWNSNWAPNVEIDVPEITDSRWKSRVFNAKTYYTLGAPASAMRSNPNYQPPKMNPVQPKSGMTQLELHGIHAKLDEIINLLKNGQSSPSTPGLEDIPTVEVQDSYPPQQSGPIM